MSDFDRSETFRRSIRRPRKLPAPLPPTPASTQDPPGDVSSIIKRLLITKRDFVALPPQKPIDAAVPTVENDSSHSALMAIQHQINKLEFNAAVRQNEMEFPTMNHQSPIGRRRHPEIESHLNKGLSNLISPDHDNDDTDQDEGKQFDRGTLVRSSVQGVPGNRADPKQFKQSRPIGRTASDSKQVQVERIRKNIKQKEAILKAEFGTKKADQVK